MAKLTDGQERFVQELLKGKTQREAYRAAFPKSVKWTDNAVDVNACKLFKLPNVSLRYGILHDKLMQQAEDESIVSAKQVLRELASIAFARGSDYARIVEDGGCAKVSLTPTEELAEDKKAAIASIRQTQAGIEVKQHDKVKALELLGKHLKLFTDKQEISGGVQIAFTNEAEEWAK